MANKVKRTGTKYPNIYFNESTKKYDIKYNYKEYSPLKGKNVYKAKWIYNCATITEARAALANLQSGGYKEDDKDITLNGALELWKMQAIHKGLSSQTILNTEQQLKAISKFLPSDTKLKNITEQVYYQLTSSLKQEYSGETVHSLDGTFRKLMHVAYKQKLITDNFLREIDRPNLITSEPKTMKYYEFKRIDEYLGSITKKHKGYNAYPKLQFFYNTLYFTGMRIGECLAITWEDFEEYNYYPEKDRTKENFRLIGTSATDKDHLIGMRVNVNKAILNSGEIKEPKNKKNRNIPIPPGLEIMYYREHNKHIANGGNDTDRVFTYSHTYSLTRLKDTCKALGLDTSYNCHTFRHTYISNLIANNIPLPIIEKVSGDTQATIFRRYSHMFEGEERLVLKAMENVIGK